MKIIKKILFTLLSVIVLILIVAAFVDKEKVVERSIEVNMKQEDAFNYFKYLKNQNDYAVWNSIDPNIQNSYSGDDGTVGFIAKWESNNKDVGAGEQEIMTLESPSRIETELRFLRPMETTNDAYMTFDEKEGLTKVSWGIQIQSPWPMNIMFLFIDLDKNIGKDLQKGLENAKSIIEK